MQKSLFLPKPQPLFMKTYSLEEWEKALKNDEKAVVIDVRSTDEFAEGHLEGATLIDVQDPQHFVDEIAKLDKSSNYYIYCNSGNRGNQACLVMDYNGFEHTFNLEGGYQAWKEANA